MRHAMSKVLAVFLVFSLLFGSLTTLGTAYANEGAAGVQPAAGPVQAPAQIALAMTSDPQTSISINWTTIDSTLTNAKVTVWPSAASESAAVQYDAAIEKRTVSSSTLLDSNSQPVTEKNFYAATLTGLTPNTEYNYRVGASEIMSEVRSFRTAQANEDAYTFIYVSDSQVADAHSKGWNANMDIAKSMYPDAKFIYIAGDITNTAANEGQWESFFNQPGNAQYNDVYSGSFISEIPLAATMGNHDSSNGGIGGMNSHYTWGSQVDGVPVTYAFDYGAARMIIINIEDNYSMNNDTAREAQTEFLRNEVSKAKADGKWAIVGFHKSIYSGANHMDDTNVIYNRKYWSPILAEIGVDAVLQGHDHVLSRGFVKADGYKADVTTQIADRTFVATQPEQAPLYYVGNTGSTLKFYAPLLTNDWIKEGDPVAPDFGYLDINSALPAGHPLNPLGPCTNDDLEATDPSFYRTPTFTAVTVSKDTMKFETYMTGFNSTTNTIVKDTFLYDSLTVNKADVTVTLSADSDKLSAEPGASVKLNVTAKDKSGADVNLTGAAVAYKTDKDGIVSIAADGTVTVQAAPEEDETVRIWTEVTVREKTYTSNSVAITIDVPTDLTIHNPYASVDWTTFGQYKADFHAHSVESDGGNTPAEMIEDHYAKGFDILAMTDHNFLSTTWDRTDRPNTTYLTSARLAEITAGTDRDNRGMTAIPDSDEQSRSDHVNTFFAPFNNESGATLEGNIAMAESLGGISHINHPGRYTGGAGKIDEAGEAASNNPTTVAKYVNLFKKYLSCVGMEIINKKDGDSASDRILWDNILTKTMPNRPVWGFSNDDTHSVSATGFSYNMMLLPANTLENVRYSMENGTFYAVAKVSKRELGADFVANGPTPKITNIVVDQQEDSISIEGENYNTIEWIANGSIIATGNSIDLNDYEDQLKNYVRAQLKGDGGISFTQPFGISGLLSEPVLAEVALTADGDKLSSDSTTGLKLSLSAKDDAGADMDLDSATIVYKTDKDGILAISADGTVTIQNKPARNLTMKVWVEVTAGTETVNSNEVSILITLPEFEKADGYMESRIKTGMDDVEEYVSTGTIYPDSSDLEIVWESPTSTTDKEEQIIGLRFTGLSIPKGAKILDAYIQFEVDEPNKSTDPFDVQIRAEAVANSAAFETVAKNVSSRVMTNNAVSWKDIPLWTEESAAGPDQQTPNLAPLVQEIVDMDGWNEGNAMAFALSGTGNRTAEAYEGEAANAPSLNVIYMTNPDRVEVVSRIKNSLDDMEERSDGSLDYDSSDLEISWESPTSADKKDQLIGLRFADLSIPQGAEITEAYIQFTVDEPNKSADPFNISIYAEASANSAAFENVPFAISSRTKTQNAVSWADAPMWTTAQVAGEAQRTSNLAALVQEIVSMDGWAEGNAMSFIMSGTGNRTAESYEGGGAEEAPTLYVVYKMGAGQPQHAPTVKIYAKDEMVIKEDQNEVEYYFAIKDVENLNALDVAFSFDSRIIKFVKAELPATEGTVIQAKADGNMVRIVAGSVTPVTVTEYADVLKLTFEIADEQNGRSDASLRITKSITASSGVNEEIASIVDAADATVVIRSYKEILDLNKDGKLSISDLSKALEYYRAASQDQNWSEAECADVNFDGVVDIADYTIMVAQILRQ